MPKPNVHNIILSFFIFHLSFFIISCSESPTESDDKFLPWPPQNIDTTSHNFTWQIDTLNYPGAFQILPNGIWGADTNDVWMVAHSDDWKARIWYWNGKAWTAWTGGALGVSPNDIIGFSNNDIWLAGRRIGDNPVIKSIRHWDGNDWTIVEHNIETDIRSLWGSSSNNIFFGLNDGRIVHYNGFDFEIKNTGTTAQILDIHGLTETEIFAVGIESDKVQPFDSTYYYIFKYDRYEWQINNYFLSTSRTPHSNLPIKGLWNNSNYFLGVNGGGIFNYNGENWEKIFNQDRSPYGLHGSAIDNIFTVGFSGTAIYHFNGKTWKNFEKLKGIDFFSRVLFTFSSKVFIPGYSNNNAYVIRGRRWSH